MSNASAMTLTLLLFACLLVSAIFVILMGGGLLARHNRSNAHCEKVEREEHKAA